MIADFNTLSMEELKQFAVDLVAKVNAAKLFHDDAELAVAEDIDLSVDETFGSLNIPVYFKDGLDISMDATWTCSEPEDATSDYDDIEFTESESRAMLRELKGTTAKLEAFTLTLSDLDYEDYEITEVEATDITDEDAGIGWYEYWGETGYDSHPYCEVEGTAYINCEAFAWLTVD